MKTDKYLGKRVNDYLIEVGVETPVSKTEFDGNDELKKERIEKHFNSIMYTLGLDLTDDSLIDTPRRVAKMYVDEIFYGLDYDKFPKATTVDNKMK